MVLQGERKEESLTSCGRRIDGSGHLGLCKERVEVGIVGETGGLGFNRIIQLIKLKYELECEKCNNQIYFFFVQRCGIIIVVIYVNTPSYKRLSTPEGVLSMYWMFVRS